MGWLTFAPPPANADLLLPGQHDAQRVHIFQRVPASGHLPKKHKEWLDDTMRRWAESTRALGLEPWILYMPSKHRLLRPYLSFDADVPEPIRAWQPTDLPDLVERIAHHHGIGFLDPRPRLEKAIANGKRVYNPLDIHLSREGSRLMGGFLTARLEGTETEEADQENL